jgi:glycine cleavage system H protein
MTDPQDARYTENAAWVRLTGDVAVMGLTNFGQQRLGTMTEVDFPPVGQVLTQGKVAAVVESVKSVFHYYAPLSGTVVARNETLLDTPTLLNEDCYGAGWMLKVQPANLAELDGLMTVEQFASWLKIA